MFKKNENKKYIGQKVMLKSGGPNMTIIDVFGSSAICEWQYASGSSNKHTFPIVCLTFLK